MTREEKTIAILGGGNGAFGVAADLQLRGFRVRLFETPSLRDNILQARKQAGIELLSTDVPGVRSGFAKIDVITFDPQEALVDASTVLLVVPAYAEKHFVELCASYFRPEQLVVSFCGGLGSALELAHTLTQRLETKSLPLIAEVETLVFASFKQDAAIVRISGRKSGLTCAALPPSRSSEALTRLQQLFPDFAPARSIAETGLRNLNPVVHPPISLLNAGRTSSDKPKWRYYWEGVTEPVGRLVEQVDRERLAVASAFDLTLPPARDVLFNWYGHQSAPDGTLGQTLSTNPAYEALWAPQTLDHRFLTEDIPYGLVPMESIAASVGVNVPITSALISISSTLLDRDFRGEGRNLERLGLSGLPLPEIKRVLI